jgi:hypothetical protein
MSKWESRFQHLVNFLVAGTGIGYAAFKYFGKYFAAGADPFSAVGNPLEPLFHDAHVLVVPALVFACGLIWKSHVLKNLRTANRLKRSSGLGLLCVLVPMVATGYMIQTAVDDGWRKAWVMIHLITSGVWVASYLSHSLVPAIKQSELSLRWRRRAPLRGKRAKMETA